jgi:AbrB family looped-hinge helix DNA binding protein
MMPLVMVIKLDKQGRIVLPKEIRDKYHLEPDMELRVIEREDSIELCPAAKKVSLRKIFEPGIEFKPEDVLALNISNLDDDVEVLLS